MAFLFKGGKILKTYLEEAFPPFGLKGPGSCWQHWDVVLGGGGTAVPNVHLAFYAWTVLQLLGKFLTPGFSGERFVIRHHHPHPSQQTGRHCLRWWVGEGKGYMRFSLLPGVALLVNPSRPLPPPTLLIAECIGLGLGDHSGACRQRAVFC